MPQPQLISDFKRVAVAGKTADNREIKEQWLKDIEETFDRKLYGARVWPEHLRGIMPGSDFKAQGDVIAVKTQIDNINGENRLCLYAQIAPLPELVEMNRRREKIYTSIEVTPNFAGSGKAYLSGLAVTDSPASLGTEELTFSANRLNTQISDPIETTFTFSEQSNEGDGNFKQFMQSVKDKIAAAFSMQSNKSGEQLQQVAELFEELTEQVVKRFDAQGQKIGQLEQREQDFAKLEKAQQQIKTELDALKANYDRLNKTPANPARPPATGGDGYIYADC